MSTLAVVEQILRETKVPMSVKGIVERAGESLPTRSKTPDTVVARDLSMDIKRKGEDSIFIRTSPGRYTMREFVTNGVIQSAESATTSEALKDSSAPSTSEVRESATPMLGSAISGGPMPARSAESDSAHRQDSEDTATA
jgi:hypothetical protein